MNAFSPRQIVRSISLIYRVVFLSLIAFVVFVALYVSNVEGFKGQEQGDPFILKSIIILSAIILIPVSYIVPQKKITDIDKTISLTERLTLYRNFLLIRFAVLEGAGFLAAIGFLILQDNNLMIVLAMVILALIIFKPSPFKIAADLGLTESETQQIAAD